MHVKGKIKGHPHASLSRMEIAPTLLHSLCPFRIAFGARVKVPRTCPSMSLSSALLPTEIHTRPALIFSFLTLFSYRTSLIQS